MFHMGQFNDMWVSFKSEVIAAIERFILSKMTKTKYSSPCIDSSIKRLIKRQYRLYFRARKSSSPDIKSHHKRFRAHVQKVIRDAYWKHISNIFSFDTDSADPDCLQKMRRQKSFGHLSSPSRKTVWDHFTQRKWNLKTDTLDKVNTAIDNLSQLSHANLILKFPQKALAHSPHG